MGNKAFIIILLSVILNSYSQNQSSNNNFIEDEKGKVISSEEEKKIFLSKSKQNKENEINKLSIANVNQTAVEMCTNGGFEQHESVSGSLKLKNFLHTIGDPPGPTECRSLTNSANAHIDIYNPNNTSVMATTVPANIIDPYIGNINAFNQYALKINYANSSTYGSIVQGKRYKTNNENYLKFNYKAVLMTVYDSGHTDNQPFVKARILNSAGTVVNEFCLVGDEDNCIFTVIPDSSSPILYTANWQSGLLDISSIPNNEEFTVEFMASRCGFGGHFGYMYVDDICLLHSNENFQGTIELNPLNKVCPTLPINVCGSYTVPNSGGITATLGTITLNIYNSTGTSIFNTTTTSSLDTVNKQFCFTLNPANFPNIINGNYNIGVTATYNLTGNAACGSTVLNSANDPDANPGWDISFQNCSSTCNFEVNTTKLSLCDANHDGLENFNLNNANSNIVASTTGLTFSYFSSFNDANANTNAISNSTSYSSASKIIYVRVTQNATCFKIIAITLEVRNPNVNISGILNVCSGSTVLTASPGTNYLWSTGATTQNITVTSIGTYSVTVTDASGCSNNASVTIEASQIATTPNVTVTQPNCSSTTGSIQITSTAAEYSFDNGVTWVTNPILTNLYPNTYNVKIKTVNNCISFPLAVTINAALTSYPNFNFTNPAFCGDFGSITITTSAPYYSFDDGITWVTNPIAINLPNGTYKIRTKDAQGCISNFNTVIISSLTLETPTFTVINPACGVNGSLTINTLSDFYSFDGGTTWVTSNVLTNLTSGSYSLAIKNNLGCTSQYTYAYINDLQDTYPEISVIQPICGSGGSIAITTFSNLYSFDDGVTWVTNNIATNLPPGQYIIKVKNSNGCVSLSNSVYLYPPTLDYPIIDLVQPQCGINGTITINTLSDFYSFDGGTTWVTNNVMSLPEGNYPIMIKNNLGCTSYTSYAYLYTPVLPAPFYTVVQPTCANTGSITINTVAAFYSIDSGTTWVTNSVFNNLTGGYYDIRIKNTQGCISDYLNINLDTTYLPLPTFTYTNPYCGNVGSITFTSSAAFYSIDNGVTWSSNPVFSNLTSNYYNLVVKNSAGCVSNQSYAYLNSYSLSNPNFTSDFSCTTNTGTITITTPAFQYSIDNGSTWSSNSVFSNLSGGTYYIKIKNSAGCTSDYLSYYLSYSLDNPIVTTTQPSCGVNGSISINTSAAFYSIDGGSTWVTNPVFSNLVPGTYYVKIKNSTGCVSYTNYVSLFQPYISNPNIITTQPTCGVGGTINISTVASQYSIDNGVTWQTNPIFSNLTPGYYSVVIKNSLNCISQGVSIYMNIYHLPNPNFTVVQPSCGSNGSITIATTSSQYSFDGGNTWVTNPVLTNLTSGYYYIAIKNSQGCTSNPSSVYVNINPYYLPSPFFTIDQPSCGNGGNITVLTTADFYSFDNGTTWTTNPVFNNPAPGYYNVKIKNNLGCTSNSQYANVNSFYLPSPNTIVTQPTCSVPTGSIKVNTPADQYSFDNGVTWTSNSILSNLPSGSYNIKIKNSLGCESSSSYVYIQSVPFIPSAPTANVTQPSSCGTTDGSITVTTTANEYSFNNGVTWTTNPTKINLAAGTYNIKTRNNTFQCESATLIVNLNSGAAIASPTFTVSNPGCNNLNGSITITTSASYYSFDNGFTFVSSNTKTNLAPGTYQLKIKDAAGCISTASSATIVNSINISAPSVTVTQPDCSTSTGSIVVNTTSSLYSFDNGVTFSSSNTQSGLTTGNYLIKIKDATGCLSDASSVTINSQPTTPNAPTISIVHPLNCTTSTGTITVTSSASLYSFDNGITWSNNNFSIPLNSGTYQVLIKETPTGCPSAATTAIINAPPNAPATPTIVITQPASCVNPFGSISITSSAFEYSFDNGLTYSNNPNSLPLAVGTYEIKVKNSSNCESSSVTAVINAPSDYPIAPLFTIVQPDCNNSNGSISIVTSATEYSFDNGVTWTTNPNLANLTPATYKLRIKNALGCYSPFSDAVIVAFTNFPNAPILTSPQTFCIQQNATLNDVIISGSNIKWYNASTAGNLLASSTILVDGTTYFASQTIGGCESLRVPVTISIQNTIAPNGDANQIFCSTANPTLNNIILSGTAINWYANSSNTTILPNSTSLVDGVTYFATQTINGCESVNRFSVTVSLINSLNANDYSQSFCDDLNDGSENVLLSDYNSNLISSTANTTFTYYTSLISAENQVSSNQLNPNYTLNLGSHTIYVRLDSTNGCHQIVKLELTLFQKPIILINDVMPICISSNIVVNAGSGFNSYSWSTGATTESITISIPGTYFVTVTKNYGTLVCSSTKTFNVVESEIASITSVEIEDWTDSDNVIIVSTAINDNYLYSLDGVNYQTSNTFSGLMSGFYTVYVKDECGIVKKDVVLLNYPRYFTPNDDGINDYWKINFSQFEPNLSIVIFDRYSKIIKEMQPNSVGWDGTYNGAKMISDDYWFVVKRQDGREHRAHFSLKR
ncbi:T9SS type B sorting domain-containing protein [Flavobacterium koreense]